MGDWYYNRIRPIVTLLRAVVGLHSDFRPIGQRIANPNGLLFVVSMANVSYSSPRKGRVVTFDVRTAKNEFVHHVQTEIPAVVAWTIGWYDDKTVFVKSATARPEAFLVGTCSLVYKIAEPYDGALMDSINSTKLPRRKVSPTCGCHRNFRVRL